MIKYQLIFFFITAALTAMGQKRSVVNLIRSQSSESTKLNGRDVVKVYKGTFQQDYSIMRSDSAYFYVQDNAFDAFGHVHITQGDTLNIYADKLNYNGNTKVALLTDNVKMIDKDATLTTNFLTYNTATRIGTYTGGGKLVNKDNVLTSRNGYYFAFSRDSYFRYNVVLVTPDALIKTDTLRYNTGSRIAFFYGPTNIYDAKDKKDTLYTENGTYNTVTEQAFFGKNNLYKQNTKTLKGDSLFYDKIKGFGKAVRHITFHDREQNITLKGDLATYYKTDERTVVTKDPYVVIVTEEKDTTRTDTVVLKPENKQPAVTEQVIKKTAGSPIKAPALPQKGILPAKVENVVLNNTPADTLKKSLVIPLKKDSVLKARPGPKITVTAPGAKPGDKIKRDSIYISADTLETQIMTFKNLKIYQEKQRQLRIRDTTVKAVKKVVTDKKPSKFLTAHYIGIKPDTINLHTDHFGPPITVDKSKIAGKKPDQRRPAIPEDPNFATKEVILSDTARVRIVIAHHHAKLFKSDLQAKSDSMFYSNSDSTLRMYVNPLIWTQGSQLSGDTIYMQMKNKKLDNMDLFPAAFIVNIEKTDSVHFNQISGKKMRGYFKNDKLDRIFITGNAESIYYSRDSGKVSGMQRSLSSRMRVLFKNNSASHIYFLTKPEHRYGPLAKFTEDEKILKGFIWKPKERPVSKESILPSFGRRAAAAAAKASPPNNNKKPPGKIPVKPPGGVTLKDTTGSKIPLNLPNKTTKDSTNSKPLPPVKPNTDSVKVKGKLLNK